MEKKANNNYEHYLHNIATNLPKDEKSKKFQKYYDILLATLILAPMFTAPALIALGFVLTGVAILVVCYGLVAFIGINRRKIITRRFYKVRNAHRRVNIKEVTDTKSVIDLYEDSALTLFAEPTEGILDFLYNWLNNKGVLQERHLDVYIFDGRLLKEAFEFVKCGEDTDFMCVFQKDLEIDEYNLNKFSKERFNIGARWLDDIVDNDNPLFEEEE